MIAQLLQRSNDGDCGGQEAGEHGPVRIGGLS